LKNVIKKGIKMKRIKKAQEGLETALAWIGISPKELEDMDVKTMGKFRNDLQQAKSVVSEILNLVPSESDIVYALSDLEGNRFYDLVFSEVRGIDSYLASMNSLLNTLDEASKVLGGGEKEIEEE
jgi:hypothetical protein